jgi:hypothetical protein
MATATKQHSCVEAMKQALEALESCTPEDTSTSHVIWPSYDEDAVEKAITSLHQAIAEAEKQEQPLPPVEIGVDVTVDGASVVAFYRRPDAVIEMFYSQFHPQPKREPLTNEQIEAIWVEHGLDDCDPQGFARAIEAAHGIGKGREA